MRAVSSTYCFFFRLSRLRTFQCNPFPFNRFLVHTSSFRGSALPSKVVDFGCSIGRCHGRQNWWLTSHHWIHSGNALLESEKDQQPQIQTEGGSVAVEGAEAKGKRKKLKGKRAVVRWLKFFMFKKKKDYKRMTDEEKLLYKLKKVFFMTDRLLPFFVVFCVVWN